MICFVFPAVLGALLYLNLSRCHLTDNGCENFSSEISGLVTQFHKEKGSTLFFVSFLLEKGI